MPYEGQRVFVAQKRLWGCGVREKDNYRTNEKKIEKEHSAALQQKISQPRRGGRLAFREGLLQWQSKCTYPFLSGESISYTKLLGI